VVFGSLMLIGSILHFNFIALYILPSTTYYLASTSPTLIQALASRYRGGVKITKVFPLADAAGCVEVHVATNDEAAASLNREPSQFVKLCVPKISVIWHPFTVFAHPTDPRTLRFLFRPIGPFTKELGKQLTSPTRPVTILDGFYKGANRCLQAMNHDCVTIVCGGVAITPFLSMIPALLTELSMVPDCPIKTISFHWACREKGLMDHIVKNYLAFFLEQAKSAKKVKLEITVYYTARNANNSDVSKITSLDGHREISKEETQHDNASSSSLDGKDDSKGLSENDGKDDSKRLSEHEENVGKSAMGDDAPGFPMEVGRLMAGRFSRLYFNIPGFVALNVAIWCGHAIIYETYHWNESQNFKQMSATAFMTLVMTAMFGVFGVIAEAMVLYFRPHWPTPTFDNFVIYLPVADNENGGKWNLGESEFTSFKIVCDRPTGVGVLKAAREAEAPGIFTCGPAQMMDMVRHETNKENSWLGITRFCLYDEPFEF
jgi:ferredoxin-NADP reductase